VKEKPDVVKMLEKEEEQGLLQNRIQKYNNELEASKLAFADVPDDTNNSVKNNIKKIKTTSELINKTLKENNQKENEKYRLITENTNDLISITTFNMKATYTYVNPSYKKNLGYKTEELIGKSSITLLHPDDKRKLIPLLKKYIGMKVKKLLTGKNSEITERLEFRIIDKSGNWHYLECTANIIGDEILFISKDITERKKITLEIEKTKNELEIKNKELENTVKYANHISLETKNALTELDQIFNSVGSGMLVIDKNYYILKMNDTFSEIFGFSKSKCIGRKCYEVLNKPACHSNECPLNRILKDQERIELEISLKNSYGEIIPCSIIITAFKDPNDNILGIIENWRNISEWKKAEEKIKKQNSELKKLNNLKSAFLSVTSHELRTPISSIKGYIQMLLKGSFGNLNNEQKNSLEIVLRNSSRLDNLIQDILDFSRLESGTMNFSNEETDISSLIKDIYEVMQPSANLKEIKINIHIEKYIPKLIIDKDRIKQVIINLVNNAIKFSTNGSIINIKVLRDKNNILFIVQDFGRGVPKEKQDKIFLSYYQADSERDIKFGGAGLGLAISRSIVVAHGGCIWVESSGISGEGSSFHFTIPIKPVENIECRFDCNDVIGLYKNGVKND
jgi:PAS domain S-box-containing protein